MSALALVGYGCHTSKFYGKFFSCDGQGAVRQAILYEGRSFSASALVLDLAVKLFSNLLGPVVQSIVGLMGSLRGQLIMCFKLYYPKP